MYPILAFKHYSCISTKCHLCSQSSDALPSSRHKLHNTLYGPSSFPITKYTKWTARRVVRSFLLEKRHEEDNVYENVKTRVRFCCIIYFFPLDNYILVGYYSYYTRYRSPMSPSPGSHVTLTYDCVPWVN